MLVTPANPGDGLQDRCSCEAAPRRDTTLDVYIIKVAPRRFFKPLRYVVPHFFRACQNHRSHITECLAPESKGLNFQLNFPFADKLSSIVTPLTVLIYWRGLGNHNDCVYEDGCS